MNALRRGGRASETPSPRTAVPGQPLQTMATLHRWPNYRAASSLPAFPLQSAPIGGYLRTQRQPAQVLSVIDLRPDLLPCRFGEPGIRSSQLSGAMPVSRSARRPGWSPIGQLRRLPAALVICSVSQAHRGWRAGSPHRRWRSACPGGAAGHRISGKPGRHRFTARAGRKIGRGDRLLLRAKRQSGRSSRWPVRQLPTTGIAWRTARPIRRTRYGGRGGLTRRSPHVSRLAVREPLVEAPEYSQGYRAVSATHTCDSAGALRHEKPGRSCRGLEACSRSVWRDQVPGQCEHFLMASCHAGLTGLAGRPGWGPQRRRGPTRLRRRWPCCPGGHDGLPQSRCLQDRIGPRPAPQPARLPGTDDGPRVPGRAVRAVRLKGDGSRILSWPRPRCPA